jgi:hypothetical protein
MTVAPTTKTAAALSLAVALLLGAVGSAHATPAERYSGSHVLYQDVFIPSAVDATQTRQLSVVQDL